MKRMTFTSSIPSHVYTGLHLLERLCCLHLVGAQQYVRSCDNERRVGGVITLSHEYLTKDPSSLIGTRMMHTLLEKRFIRTPGGQYWCRLVTVADTDNGWLTNRYQ
jgi:hypothetical protein